MEDLKDLLPVLIVGIPSAVVFLSVQLITKTAISKEELRKETEVLNNKIATIYPLQLQAYERLCMFVERISPDNLVIRSNKPGLSVIDFQRVLFNEINNEYTHNISQQVYISDKAWGAVKNAVETLKMNINTSAASLRGNEVAVSTDLAKKILETAMQEKHNPIEDALKILRKEVKRL